MVVRLFGLVLMFVSIVAAGHAATPCDGMEQKVSSQEEKTLAAAIVRQLNDKKNPQTAALQHVSLVDVYKIFRSGGWEIIYMEPDVADPAYLFYQHDPLTSNYIDLWGDEAPSEQRAGIEKFVVNHDVGIPAGLAACFAWAYTGGE